MARLANTLAEAEAELLRHTSRYLKADTEVDTLHDNLVKAKVQALGDRLGDVEFKALSIGHSLKQCWRPRTNGK